MIAAGRQTTLPDFDLFPPLPLQTDPPTYLHTNDIPDTQPTLITAAPIPEPPNPAPTPAADPPGEQRPLTAYAADACPVCHRVPENVSEHLLTEHADTVNERLAELQAERESTDTDDYAERVVEREPAMFAEVEPDPPGERLDAPDARACNDCGTVMSAGYRRIFGWEDGTLYCPDCRSRAERYTNDPARQHGSYSHPEQTTGTDNPRYNYEPEAASPDS